MMITNFKFIWNKSGVECSTCFKTECILTNIHSIWIEILTQWIFIFQSDSNLLFLSLFKRTCSLPWKLKLIARLLLLVCMLYPSCSACGSHWYVTRVMTFLLCANISSYRDTIKWIGVDGDIKAHGENFLGMNYCTRKNVITNIPFE